MSTGNREEFLIDRMDSSDLKEVAALERETFSDPWSEEGFSSELRQPFSLYLTARMKQTGELAGYCGLLISEDTAEIVNVAVREEFRNRGIGGALLCRLIEEGRARGVDHFTLEVRKSNRAALHLYEKLGFSPAGIRPGFYEKPKEDAWILWK